MSKATGGSTTREHTNGKLLDIHIVSGGVGASAELLAHTVLAQFPGIAAPLHIHSHINEMSEVQAIVKKVALSGGLILHTLVNPQIRAGMVEEAARQQVDAIDVAGPILDYLTQHLAVDPIGQAGRYRKLYGQYFERVEAIEFTIAHDDGQRSVDLAEAEIVLVGVSRLGKTPLSIYLAMQGWKVANVPFVLGLSMPTDFWRVDRRRVIGLMIEPPQLAIHRKWREKRLGVKAESYVEQKRIAEELREANRFFAEHDISVVDVTSKPIETSGTEIISTLTRQLNSMPAQLVGEA